jgi:hypothetical protein
MTVTITDDMQDRPVTLDPMHNPTMGRASVVGLQQACSRREALCSCHVYISAG